MIKAGKSHCIFFLFVLWTAAVFAQKPVSSENDLKKQADKNFSNGNYETAAPMYSQLLSLYPKESVYSFRYGVCLLLTGKDKSNAIAFLETASKDKETPEEVWQYLGKAYMLAGKYTDAITVFTKFKSTASSGKIKKFETDLMISNANSAIELLKTRKNVAILSSKVCSRSNFSSCYDFTNASGRLVPTAEQFLTREDKEKQINPMMFITRDGQSVYFASYGKGAEGGKDIYVSHKQINRGWGEPENAGNRINTAEDEDFPYITADGKTLYFSSRGHNSIGGYDIFKSNFDFNTGKWSAPENLGIPLNTVDDDLLFLPEPTGYTATYATAFEADNGKVNVRNVNFGEPNGHMISIAGNYISVDQPTRRDARISVIRESDQAVITSARTNPVSGSYELVVPAGDEYIVLVEGGSYMPHTEKFSVSPVAPEGFRQLIKLNRTEDKEELTFVNYLPSAENTGGKTPTETSPVAQEVTRAYDINRKDSASLYPVTIDNQVVYATVPAPLSPANDIQLTDEPSATTRNNDVNAGRPNPVVGNESNAPSNTQPVDAAIAANDQADTISAEEVAAVQDQVPTSGQPNTEPAYNVNINNEELTRIAFEDARSVKEEADSLAHTASVLRIQAHDKDSLSQKLLAESAQLPASEHDRSVQLTTQANILKGEVPLLNDQADQLDKQAAQRSDDARLALQEAQTLANVSDQPAKPGTARNRKPQTAQPGAAAPAVVVTDARHISQGENPPAIQPEQAVNEKSNITADHPALQPVPEKQPITSSTAVTEENLPATNSNQAQANDAKAKTTGQEINTSAAHAENMTPASVTETTADIAPVIMPEIKEEAAQKFTSCQTKFNQSKSLELINEKIQIRIASLHPGPERDSLTNVSADLTRQSIGKWKEAQLELGEAKSIDPDVEQKMAVINSAKKHSPVVPSSSVPETQTAKAADQTTAQPQALAAAVPAGTAPADATSSQKPVTEISQVSGAVAENKQSPVTPEEGITANAPVVNTTPDQLQNKVEPGATQGTIQSPVQTAAETSGQTPSSSQTQTPAQSPAQVSAENPTQVQTNPVSPQGQVAQIQTQPEFHPSEMNPVQTANQPATEKIINQPVLTETQSANNEKTLQSPPSQNTITSVPPENKPAAETPSITQVNPVQQSETVTIPVSGHAEQPVNAPPAQIAATTPSANQVPEHQQTQPVSTQAVNTQQAIVAQPPVQENNVQRKVQDQQANTQAPAQTVVVPVTEPTPVINQTPPVTAQNISVEPSVVDTPGAPLRGGSVKVVDAGAKPDYIPVTNNPAKPETAVQQTVTQSPVASDKQYLSNPAFNKLQKKIDKGQTETVQIFAEAVSLNKRALEEKEKQVSLMDEAQNTTDPEKKAQLSKEAEKFRMLSEKDEQASKEKFAEAQRMTAEVKDLTAKLEEIKSGGAVKQDESAQETPVVKNEEPPSILTTASEIPRISLTREERERMTGQVFGFTKKFAYTSENPIPMNPVLPEGLVFKVQVGAFHKPIPDKSFKNIQPVSAETTRPGWVRYCVGLFQTFEPANLVKKSMRASGFRDAFVVAYFNGKRIGLAEAYAMLKKPGADSRLAYNTTSEKEMALLRSLKITPKKFGPSKEDTDAGQFYGADVADAASSTRKNQTGKSTAVTANLPVHAAGIEFTVQVGVYHVPSPPAALNALQPVMSEPVGKGLYRFTTGRFTQYAEAEQAKRDAVSKGIPDAYVIVYRDGQRISLAEAIGGGKPAAQHAAVTAGTTQAQEKESTAMKMKTVDETPVSGGNPGAASVVFKIQLGAFRNAVPYDQVEAFLAISDKGITQETDARGLHIFFAGAFPDYESALRLKTEVVKKGVTDAFIAVFLDGKRTTIEEALKALRR